MQRHPPAPVNVAKISVATFRTDFIAPEADFAALIRAGAAKQARSSGAATIRLSTRRWWRGRR
jgi:hypothetical protein